MTDNNPISVPSSLVDRIKNILLKPKEEWARIDAEPATIGGIYTSWVVLLAAIPAVATLIGSQLFGYGFFGVHWKPSLTFSISTAISGYVMSLIGVFVLALIIDWLAPNFGGTQNRVQAFKVAAYSATASWLAGIFSLIPGLGFLGILGLYSLYLLYTGLPMLMKAPADKAMTYTIVTIIAAIILFAIIGTVGSRVGGLFGGGMNPADMGEVSGTMSVPGVGSVDLGKMQEASKKMEAAAQSAQSGQAGAVAPAELQAMLPGSIGAWQRTSIESESMAAGGMGGSNAEARYEAGGKGFTLSITDMAAAGAFAAMGAALNVQQSKQTEDGYEKTSTANGRLVNEEWHKTGNGTYMTTVGSRFMVKAEGDANSIDDLKGAVASVDLGKLEAMAK